MTLPPVNAEALTPPPAESEGNGQPNAPTSSPMNSPHPAPSLEPASETNGQTNSHSPDGKTRSRKRRGSSLLRLGLFALGMVALVGLLLAGGVALGVVTVFNRGERPDLILHKVQYERIQLTITER